jgi:hypothetical protein
MAYAGYVLGIHLAREQQTLHKVSDLIPKKRFPFRKKLSGTHHDSHTKGSEVSHGVAPDALDNGTDDGGADSDRHRDG